MADEKQAEAGPVTVKLARSYWDGSVMHPTGTVMQFPNGTAPKSAKEVSEAELPDVEEQGELPLGEKDDPKTLSEMGKQIPPEVGTTSGGAKDKKKD